MSLDEQLIEAAQKGNIKEVRSLLKKGADVNVKDSNGHTPLHLAAIYGDTEIVKLLLEYRAEVNIKDVNQCTPLYHAAEKKHIKIIKLLLDNNANPDIYDCNRFTPLLCATFRRDAEVIKLLLNGGANIHVEDRSDCLHWVAQFGYAKDLFLFLLYDSHINQEDRKAIINNRRFFGCLAAFEQIKAMPHLGRLIEANIKKEGAKAIANYINNKAEGQELIKEFSAITKSSDKQLSFVPEHLFSLIKKIGLDYKISKEIGEKVISNFLEMQEVTGADYISPGIASNLNHNDIMNVALSNKQSYKVLKPLEPLNKLMTELKNICQKPNTALAASQSEAVPSQSRCCIS